MCDESLDIDGFDDVVNDINNDIPSNIDNDNNVDINDDTGENLCGDDYSAANDGIEENVTVNDDNIGEDLCNGNDVDEDNSIDEHSGSNNIGEDLCNGNDEDISIDDSTTSSETINDNPSIRTSEETDTASSSDDFDGSYDNIGNMDFNPFPDETAEEQLNEPSTLRNIMDAGAYGLYSPSDSARIVSAGILRPPPGAEDAYAQLLQAGWNMGVEGVKGMSESAIRQHGISAGARLNNMQIQQEIENGSMGAGPLLDNQDIYDENGVNLTDECLRDE